MQVTLSPRVETALDTLGRDDRERVRTWLAYLSDWDQNAFVKSQSVLLDVQGQSVYLFRTSTDVRIFYTVDPQRDLVTVLDVTTKDTILSSGNVPVG